MELFNIFIIFTSCVLVRAEKANHLIQNHRMKRSVSPIKAQISKMKTCDQSLIPVMQNFEMSKFAGEWHELGKSVSNYIDVNDGIWKILNDSTNNNKFKFLYSGRNSDEHCIKPLSGTIMPINETPGELTLSYKTFTTVVKETIRILHTDYHSVAVLYSCMHINEHTGGCHPAGVLGSLWTRKPHVSVRIYDEALKYLEQACIDPHIIKIRNIIGPCQIDNLDVNNENEVVHDMCYQSLDVGSCSANLKRFYYDKTSKQCKEFTYGGCSGNKNNFLSMQECEQQCLNVGESIYPDCKDVSPCALHCPPCCQQNEDGCVSCDCESIIVDESFDCVDARDCPLSCHGKEIYPNCYQCTCPNNEKTDVPPVCQEPKIVGPCVDKKERYYFNTTLRDCIKFTFSGCGENGNNFISLVDCLEKCLGNNVQDTVVKMKPVKDDDGAPQENYLHIATLLISTLITLYVTII